MDTPKYYFGDISNETSNFILITARIPFAEKDGKKSNLQPFEVEGPYDKCMDWQFHSDPKEYYMLLVKQAARLAGWHKAGKLGTEAVNRFMLGSLPPDHESPKAWGCNPEGSTGDPDAVKKIG